MTIDAQDCEDGLFSPHSDVVVDRNYSIGSRQNLLLNTQLLPVFFYPFRPVPERFTDIKKRAEELDALHPESTFVHELGLYPENIVLVTGPFGSLPAILTFWWSSLRASGRCRPLSFGAQIQLSRLLFIGAAHW